ncbi:MAG TPA: hypothetical protein VGL56_07265 [Fimbriimonadaceae bacterium]|jgi:tetratricopeptide (TPR) repeat protein
MKVAVLPFNVTDGTKPALGRQLANVIAETVKAATGADINSVNYLAQVQEGGEQRAAFVNMGTTLAERSFFEPLFNEAGAEKIMHGLMEQTETGFAVHVRFEAKDSETPLLDEQQSFATSELFSQMHWLMQKLAGQAGVNLPPALQEKLDVGTTSPEAFLAFLEGYDGLLYVQQANGKVVNEFQPNNALEVLLKALELDPKFQPAFDTAIQFCRACAHFRIGTFQFVESTLKQLGEMVPGDYRPMSALGEVFQEMGDMAQSSNYYEKAIAAHEALGDEIDPVLLNERGVLYSRLGMVQLNLGMPVNAERNFRKAIELEDDEKASLDMLSSVLAQTNRQHEIVGLWKDEAARNPKSAKARTRYATALISTGQKEEGIRAFDEAIDDLEDKVMVKRFYAPILSQTGDLDRAMDFYEDCLDVAPNDIPLMIEYANTLKSADREFEVPQVLRNILASNPDLSTKAQALAWLIEIEQPKRVEVVEEARKQLEEGDAETAIKDLKPLRNWLADYWKLWAVLSVAFNRLEMPEEAQDAANRLLNLFPTYEPAYAEMVNALTKLGRDEEAYNVMRHAANNVGSLGVHVNLALAAKRAGHDEEARSIVQQLRQAVGPNEELEQTFAEIEA